MSGVCVRKCSVKRFVGVDVYHICLSYKGQRFKPWAFFSRLQRTVSAMESATDSTDGLLALQTDKFIANTN